VLLFTNPKGRALPSTGKAWEYLSGGVLYPLTLTPSLTLRMCFPALNVRGLGLLHKGLSFAAALIGTIRPVEFGAPRP